MKKNNKYLKYLSLIFLLSIRSLNALNPKSIQFKNAILKIVEKNYDTNSTAYKNRILNKINNILPVVDHVECKKNQIKKIISEKTDVLLSFIIPCFNRSNTIETALDSILSQQYDFDYEVICIDDASTDNSAAIIERYATLYPTVKLIKHNGNMGAPYARNTGIIASKGKLIFNLDSDDIVPPGEIQKMVNLYRLTNCDIICFDQAHTFLTNKRKPDKDTAINQVNMFPQNTDIYNIELFNQKNAKCWSTCNICKLFSKKSWFEVGGFIEESGHDAIAFNILQLLYGYDFLKSPNSYYYHHVWPNEQSMWYNDLKKNVTGKSFKKMILYCSEFFTPNTIKSITNLHIKEEVRLVSAEVYFKKLEFVNYNSTIHLSRAYQLEIQGKSQDALNAYIKCIQSGNHHIKVILKAIRACLISNRNLQQIIEVIKDVDIYSDDYTLSALCRGISQRSISPDIVRCVLQSELINVNDTDENNQNALDSAVVFADAPEYVKAIIEGSSPSDLSRAAEHVDNNGRDLKAHLQAKNNEFIREGRQIGGRRDRRSVYQMLKNNGLVKELDLNW